MHSTRSLPTQTYFDIKGVFWEIIPLQTISYVLMDLVVHQLKINTNKLLLVSPVKVYQIGNWYLLYSCCLF